MILLAADPFLFTTEASAIIFGIVLIVGCWLALWRPHT